MWEIDLLLRSLPLGFVWTTLGCASTDLRESLRAPPVKEKMRGKITLVRIFCFHITYFLVRFLGTDKVQAFLFLALFSSGQVIGLIGLE